MIQDEINAMKKTTDNGKHFEAYRTAKPLAQFSPVRTYCTIPFHRRTAGHCFRFISSILTNFFLLQQKQKLGLTHIPVVHVDHPLDEKITFTPEKVNIYLDFVAFFVRIFSMMLKTFGQKIGANYCADYLDFLKKLYDDAASVYSQCLTTTNRPHYKKNFRFLLIHMFDPHLLCVPSLHVAIVAGSWAFVRTVFSQNDVRLSEEKKQQILAEIYGGAVAIIETVLYVKQHSINCVSAALYMLSATGKDCFSADDAKKITDDLFATQNDIEKSAKAEIRAYIFFLYTSLRTAAKTAPSWQQPILDFLHNYPSAAER